MILRTVQKDKDLDAFIDLPYRLYRKDPVWVPPLRSEQRGQFDPERNPLLNHCEYGLFLLESDSERIPRGWPRGLPRALTRRKRADPDAFSPADRRLPAENTAGRPAASGGELQSDGRTTGRIAAFIDKLAVEYWKQPVGLFGYYECVQDGAASRLLLDAAAGWLKERGMKTMRGPWTFVSQEWGLVVEGFAPQPVIMAPYNPPYYIDHLTGYGLQKVKDLLCYSISGGEGYRIPDRILRLTDGVARRYGVRVRRVDMRQYEREVETIMDLSNISLAGNWGYSPVTPEEVQAMARDLKAIIQPRGVLFAEDPRGKPIGFAIAIPDANILLKGLNGRLLPFGWMKLLLGLPRLRAYRMFALGVVPAYQGKGIDSLLYRALYESLYSPALRMEINYVLEDNHPMNNAIRKLDAKLLRRYRIFEKEI